MGRAKILWIASSAIAFQIASAGTSRLGYEYNKSDLAPDKCYRFLTNEASTPLEVLASHVEVKPATLHRLLDNLKLQSFWNHVDGFTLHGSRAHKYWGDGYDLDIELLPQPKKEQGDREELLKSYKNWIRGQVSNDLGFLKKFRESEGFSIDPSVAQTDLIDLIVQKKIPDRAFIESTIDPLKKDLVDYLNWDEKIYSARPLSYEQFKLRQERRTKLADNKFLIFEQKHGQAEASISTIRETYLAAAHDNGVSITNLSLNTVFVLKKNPHNLDAAIKLRSMGYSHVYFLCEPEGLCSANPSTLPMGPSTLDLQR